MASGRILLLTAAAAGLVGGGLVAGSRGALATCVQARPWSFDQVQVCTGPGEEASGSLAVSLQGPARGSGPLNAAAVSGTGAADRALVAASGTGTAGTPGPPDDDPCAVREGGTSVQSGVGVSGTGNAFSCFASVSGAGNARSALVAVSGTGDSGARVLSVSGTGQANGHWNRNQPPGERPYRGALVAVSGCKADNTGPQDQLATADPTRVWVQGADPQHPLVDLKLLPAGVCA